ncbi:MAG: translation elongation factor EF-1 subunit alpha [Candidatus Poseidoniia archaeon]|jgi:elongation factor 1-alpha|nr:translation elongation factor EF-1 subunit alpha [Candidatus Poseidoniia archaeon]
MAEKPHMNVVFIGHVDHGKSTSVGRLLLETGAIEQHLVDKYRKEAEERGKGGFELAYVMDNLKEERERGVTIDVAHKRFESDKIYFTIIDAPGHRDFVKNMITGTSQADAAVLVVAADDGIEAQTKEHLWLAKVMGVEQLIVSVNKMDITKPAYSEKRFNEIKADLDKMLKMVGYRGEQVTVLPASGWMNDNIAAKSDNLGWWSGDTLLAALNKLSPPKGQEGDSLRLPVQDVYKIPGIGAVPVGRVETGTLKSGMKVSFKPSAHQGGKVGEVKSIEMHHAEVNQAVPGDNVGYNLRGVAHTDIRRGDVCGPENDPPSVARTFKASVMILDHPNVITKGYTPVFHCHTAQVACTFDTLLAKMDPRTGEVTEENPDFLKKGDAAMVLIKPTKPLAIEEQAKFKQLSRFAIRDMGKTVAAGMCLKIEESWD